MKNNTPQLYVGTYSKYAGGSIKGEWVNLDDFSSAGDFMEHIKEIHKDEEDPEFMFQDFEGFPAGFYSESMGEEELEKLFDFLSLDEHDRKMIEMYCEATGNDISETELNEAESDFHGTADSEADFAERIAEECGEIPKNLPSWIVIDWQASWDCNLRYDYNTAEEEDGTIWFYLNH